MPIKLNSILTGVEHHQGYLLVEHGPQKLSPAESVGEVEAGQGEWETEEGEVSQHDHHWTNYYSTQKERMSRKEEDKSRLRLLYLD